MMIMKASRQRQKRGEFCFCFDETSSHLKKTQLSTTAYTHDVRAWRMCRTRVQHPWPGLDLGPDPDPDPDPAPA